jgi:hypothetical protein
MNGTRLWRVDLGRNIRAGAHYTQFQVYDYDGDGRAEVAMKTADGSRDGAGTVIGSARADHRNSSGYVLSGPEFLTVFNGSTGRAMATAGYVPARGTVSGWGDDYGNRVDRFLAGTAYLNGSYPSIIMARGYYTRSVIAAWDFRNGALTRRWTFDSNSSTNGPAWAGQGNHQLSVADVDADGRDDILYGAMRQRPGCLGRRPRRQPGRRVLVERGRRPAQHHRGDHRPQAQFSANSVTWWDGDAQRELLDGTRIDKYGTGGDTRLLTASGVRADNGTKPTPSVQADILGDWREEVIWPTTDNRALRIYSTTDPTSITRPSLMQDRMYRNAVAWQNTAYNQPPRPSFAIG